MPDETAPGGQQDQNDQQQTVQPQEGTEPPGDGQQEQAQPKTFSEDYVKELRSEAAKYRKQAQASMSDSERAIAEAEERGRTAVRQEFSQRLARERFDSLAARRNPDVKTGDMLEYVDLNKFIDENGDLNEKALDAAVKRLVPEVVTAQTGPPSFDGGARTTASPPNDFNQTLRSQFRRQQ